MQILMTESKTGSRNYHGIQGSRIKKSRTGRVGEINVNFSTALDSEREATDLRDARCVKFPQTQIFVAIDGTTIANLYTKVKFKITT